MTLIKVVLTQKVLVYMLIIRFVVFRIIDKNLIVNTIVDFPILDSRKCVKLHLISYRKIEIFLKVTLLYSRRFTPRNMTNK